MPKPKFDYYYGAEAEQFSFVKVPKVLFSDKEHFGCLSNDARILYGFLLERMSLDVRLGRDKRITLLSAYNLSFRTELH